MKKLIAAGPMKTDEVLNWRQLSPVFPTGVEQDTTLGRYDFLSLLVLFPERKKANFTVSKDNRHMLTV